MSDQKWKIKYIKSDKVCDRNILFTSSDLLDRLEYDGKLSQEDVKLLQDSLFGFDYSITYDAEITIKFYHSFEIIQLLYRMTAMYDISLMYDGHIMKFNNCQSAGMIRSLSDGDDVLIEIKFVCKSKQGQRVEFEHIKICD